MLWVVNNGAILARLPFGERFFLVNMHVKTMVLSRLPRRLFVNGGRVEVQHTSISCAQVILRSKWKPRTQPPPTLCHDSLDGSTCNISLLIAATGTGARYIFFHVMLARLRGTTLRGCEASLAVVR